MKKSYVYILLCSDNSYYTGVTNDIARRLEEHNNSNSISYTSIRRPLKLEYCQEFNDIKQAIALEKQIKGWSRKKKQALINDDWESLKLLSRNHTQYPPPTGSG